MKTTVYFDSKMITVTDQKLTHPMKDPLGPCGPIPLARVQEIKVRSTYWNAAGCLLVAGVFFLFAASTQRMQPFGVTLLFLGFAGKFIFKPERVLRVAVAGEERPRKIVVAAKEFVDELKRAIEKAIFDMRHPIRTWTSADARFQVNARFLGYASGTVALQRGEGSQIDVPVNQLCGRDRRYLQGLLKHKRDAQGRPAIQPTAACP